MTTRKQQRGQTMVIAAAFMAGMVAIMGLVVDGGFTLFNRRSTQNAADAAALAAINSIARRAEPCVDATLTSAVTSDITSYVQNNLDPSATATWNFIDNTGATVASASACNLATGVSVAVSHTHGTFFMRILALTNIDVSASAQAHVRALTGNMGGAPFIACGPSLIRHSDNSAINILDNTVNPPGILKAWVGTEFNLHGPQDVGDCGAGNSFKGNADDGELGCWSLPCDYGYQNGTRAGPVTQRLAAASPACSGSSAAAWNNCVLLIPVANGLGGPSNTMNVVTWAAFQITAVSTNEHTGVLLADVVTEGPSGVWKPGNKNPVVLGLTK